MKTMIIALKCSLRSIVSLLKDLPRKSFEPWGRWADRIAVEFETSDVPLYMEKAELLVKDGRYTRKQFNGYYKEYLDGLEMDDKVELGSLVYKFDPPYEIQKVIDNGPNRVLVSSRGEATSPQEALQIHGISPVFVFIRGDGWSLGAPHQYAHVAEDLWADQWKLVLDLRTGDAKPWTKRE